MAGKAANIKPSRSAQLSYLTVVLLLHSLVPEESSIYDGYVKNNRIHCPPSLHLA